jgi:hypothetical protein
MFEMEFEAFAPCAFGAIEQASVILFAVPARI